MSGMDMGSSSSSSGSGGHDHSSMGMSMTMGDCEMMMLGNWKTIGSCFLTSSWYISTEAQFAGTCIGVFLLVVLIEAVRRWGREWDRFIVKQAVNQRRRERVERTLRKFNSTSQNTTSSSVPFSELQANGRDLEGAADNSNQINVNHQQNKIIETVATTNENQKEIKKALFGKFPTFGDGKEREIGRPLFRPTTLQQIIRSLVYSIQFAGAYIIMLIAMSFNGYILISIVLGGLFGHFFSSDDTLGMSVAMLEDEEEEKDFREKEKEFKKQLYGNHNNQDGKINGMKFDDDVSDDKSEGKFGIDSYGGASGACCG